MQQDRNETIEKVSKWGERIAMTGMSDKKFALHEVGISNTNLSQYLNGKTIPRRATVYKIETALGRLGV